MHMEGHWYAYLDYATTTLAFHLFKGLRLAASCLAWPKCLVTSFWSETSRPFLNLCGESISENMRSLHLKRIYSIMGSEAARNSTLKGKIYR
ncbi:Uncharacterized protein TCM_017299 [Theobroma cacao]|uniref:Uncharacterized protein n=1 Tax=Theobroma cacao TaxID=3641 RepID=A0A061EES0_THECC|nr:Uncharacterized protein TCM_017299 [Theobroma cacao]